MKYPLRRKGDAMRQKWFEDEQEIHLLQRGKRSALNVVFGRFTVIALLLVLEFVFLFWGAQFLGRYSPVFYVAGRVLAVLCILWLVNRPGNPMPKITWIVLIMALPVFGMLLYLFVQMDVGHRFINHRLQETIAETAEYMPAQQELMERLRTEQPELHGLATYMARAAASPIYENTAVTYFPLGEQKFEALLEELGKAEHFIFLEYFIIEEGTMWGRILKVLEQKVREGVEVRLLYDGMCAFYRLPYRYPEELEKLGIRCKMFAPLRPMVSTYYNNRDHRKIVVIDGKVAFTGGINLADEYINQKRVHGHWKDTAVMLRGDAVRSFTLMFLQMWAIDEREADDYPHYLEIEQPKLDAPGYVLPYGDSPLDDELVGEMVYIDIINHAERYVHIMTPYLIIDNEMLTALKFAAKRGVDVELLLPHVPDKKFAFALAKSHYRELLDAGVRIFEYTPGFVHAKVFVSDDCKAVVGTINLDYRSLYLHFECAAYLYGCPAIQEIEADYLDSRAKSQEVLHEDLKKIPLHTRLAGMLLKLLAPLM